MRNGIVELDEIKVKNRKWIMLVCVIAFLLGGFVFAFFKFKVEDVTVVGNDYYSDEEIKAAVFDSEYKDYIIYLWFAEKIESHKKFPFVDKYEVSMEGAHSVRITVYEKDIIGCFEQMGSYMFFNSSGTMIECSSEMVDGVPLITGISYDNAVLNEKISIPEDGVLDKILRLVKVLERNNIIASRIHFDTSGDAILYIDDIRVVLGNNSNLDGQILELKNILPILEGQAGTLDMTYYADGRDDLAYPFTYDKK